jgi:hypothetical protein
VERPVTQTADVAVNMAVMKGAWSISRSVPTVMPTMKTARLQPGWMLNGARHGRHQ